MQATATRIRAAFDARDMDLLRSLVATDATWGDDPDSDRFCHDRDEIMADYERLRDAGVVGTVIETITGPNGVACLLEVQWTDPDRRGRGPRLYQAFRVENDLITRITGHDTEAEARAAISS
jgi:hypothetical protein